MKYPGVFIAATGQNVGKTTTSLGLVEGFKKRFDRIGFIKPVGQQHVKIDEKTQVDKDVVLFKEQFNLPYHYSDMSPIIIPSGFTKNFLKGKIDPKPLEKRIKESFEAISKQSDFVIVEGTGHVGVGSIVQMSNAHVAALLGLPLILVVKGGLGSLFDEFMLNYTLCRAHGVPLLGLIVNQVIPEKLSTLQEYLPLAFEKYNLPIFGYIPFEPDLSKPTIYDFKQLFRSEFISGEDSKYRHFDHVRLVATTSEDFATDRVENELVITHASREDIVMTTISHHQKYAMLNNKDLGGGLILTGNTAPREAIVQQLKQANIPAIYAKVSSFDAIRKINLFTAKIQKKDDYKVDKAIHTIEKHVDFERLTHLLKP